MRCQQFRYHYQKLQATVRSEVWREGSYVGKLGFLARSGWCPAVDVYETEHQLSIVVELAGVSSESIDIAIYEDVIVIKGDRRLQFNSQEAGIYRLAEIQQGPFYLELPLFHPVYAEQLDGKYEQGILWLTLNKVREEKLYDSAS